MHITNIAQKLETGEHDLETFIYRFKFESCLSTNPKKFAVRKMTLSGMLDIPNNRCTQHDCSPYHANYSVIVNVKKKVSTICFDKSRVIYEKGL